MQVLANAIRTGFLVAIISLGVGSAAVADPFDDGFDAYRSGDFETALRLFQPLADQGIAKAHLTDQIGVVADIFNEIRN